MRTTTHLPHLFQPLTGHQKGQKNRAFGTESGAFYGNILEKGLFYLVHFEVYFRKRFILTSAF